MSFDFVFTFPSIATSSTAINCHSPVRPLSPLESDIVLATQHPVANPLRPVSISSAKSEKERHSSLYTTSDSKKLMDIFL